jgi:hypothetical protein
MVCLVPGWCLGVRASGIDAVPWAWESHARDREQRGGYPPLRAAGRQGVAIRSATVWLAAGWLIRHRERAELAQKRQLLLKGHGSDLGQLLWYLGRPRLHGSTPVRGVLARRVGRERSEVSGQRRLGSDANAAPRPRLLLSPKSGFQAAQPPSDERASRWLSVTSLGVPRSLNASSGVPTRRCGPPAGRGEQPCARRPRYGPSLD